MSVRERLSNFLKGKPRPANAGEGYTLYRYLDEKGNFDYEAYRKIQIEANKKKIDSVWVREENIAYLSDCIKFKIESPTFGICHGTRRGYEQKWFRQYMNCEVIGTEISDTAKDFPFTIQWDFHEVKPEWLSAVDFIYSNSLDHSSDPEKCLNAWVSCLKPNGILIIEHSSADLVSRPTDPFGAHLQLLPWLIINWGHNKFSCREIVRAPKKSRFGEIEYDTYFLFIEKNAESFSAGRPAG